jgi:ABC-2 type transport system permease protein
MPDWAQAISRLNPVSYLISVMRMVVLKGSRFPDIIPQLAITFVFAIVLNAWAIINYKKTA